MANQLSFEFEFTRRQFESLIADPSAEVIVISGTYTHDSGNPDRHWEMIAKATSYSTNRGDQSGVTENACIQPCP